MRRFIEPNKPIRTNEEFLNEIDDSYIVDSKLDGWRIEIGKLNNKIHYISRVNKNLEIPNELKHYFEKNLPDGMVVDAEWINKSRTKAINTSHNVNLPLFDCIVLFDIKWTDGKYISNTTLSERRKIDFYKNLQVIDIDCIDNNSIYRINSTIGSKAKQFYKEQQNKILSEGLVIKKKTGNLNSTWYKVKYRE